MTTALGYDDIFLQHRTGRHPERPARLTSIVEHLKRDSLWDRCLLIDSRVPPETWIRLIHSDDYINRLEQACRDDMPFIDCPDSAICPDSISVARQAVALVLAACDLIMAEKAQNALCLVRPPGHHAEKDRSMGFCLFNNIAVACRYLQQNHGLKRILILDWDVHHGNGTQHTFEDDHTVYYCSLHQHPATCYPGTGWPNEFGRGMGRGFTLNLCLEPGAGDDDWLDMFRTSFLTVARDFRPEFILISAGFDAHRKDPLAQLNLSEYAYEQMTYETRKLAEEFCHGRILSILEGGYQLGCLSSCVAQHLKYLLE